MKPLYQVIFRTPTPFELATKELEEARRSKLAAESAWEYAKAMVNYHADRIERLEQYVRANVKEPQS
jgi:hypothetical protein